MTGTIRIIGGQWRGRRLRVADVKGLRPTGDRGREALFNWLAPRLNGARCLDAFAGTGALGLEALSRGAARVVLVERDRQAAARLEAHLATLSADPVHGSARVVCADALAWMREPGERFDLVFLDPPFNRDLAGPALQALQASGLLEPAGLVYLETGTRELSALPAGWAVVRDKALGEVRMRLLESESHQPG